ncbi:MAG: hypothetical protein EXR49_09260, partial [Dehalococcoidia bacterium]|nr:hypothetical protein [Dehalococcoidia bacterium]
TKSSPCDTGIGVAVGTGTGVAAGATVVGLGALVAVAAGSSSPPPHAATTMLRATAPKRTAFNTCCFMPLLPCLWERRPRFRLPPRACAPAASSRRTITKCPEDFR